MIFIFLLHSVAVLVSAAKLDSAKLSNSLGKNLLSNLNAIHAGETVETVPATHVFNLSAMPAEETKDEAMELESSVATIKDLSPDILEYIFMFLNAKELLNTREVSRLFCNVSNHANYMQLKSYNPYFVLKENCMNLALNNFLWKHFENGRINVDDLLMAEANILLNAVPDILKVGKNLDTLNLLSFIHEYVYGAKSSLPSSHAELYLDIISKSADNNLPKSMKLIDDACLKHANSIGIKNDNAIAHLNYIHELIDLIHSKPDGAIVMAKLNFDPNLSFRASNLEFLPPSIQIALFDLILPLCLDPGRFMEALDLTASNYAFPQVLVDQLEQKFPEIINDISLGLGTISPSGSRAFYKNHPRNFVIGLDYMLTRDAANPFNLQELLALNPDIPFLISEFMDYNTNSLTEVDMIKQMNDAGLFKENMHKELLFRIGLILSGKIHFEKLRLFEVIAQMRGFM